MRCLPPTALGTGRPQAVDAFTKWKTTLFQYPPIDQRQSVFFIDPQRIVSIRNPILLPQD